MAVTLAQSRASAMDWYTNRVPSERCESERTIALKTATAKRAVADVMDMLDLPDDVLEHNLAHLSHANLARLASISAKALARNAVVGIPLRPHLAPPHPKWSQRVGVGQAAVTLVAGQAAVPAPTPKPPPLPPARPEVALQRKAWVDFPLEARTEINHNTLRLRFKLPVEELGLPVGMHIFLKAKIGGKLVMRAYTPVGFGPGYVEFVIKVYFPLLPRFPEGGKLTQHMHAMEVGDTLSFKGPLGEIDFDENLSADAQAAPCETLVRFQYKGELGGAVKHFGFVAGGSGITPCLQVAAALLKLERDITISLLYANQTAADILCEEQINELRKDSRFSVWYTVDRPADGWAFSVGFINEDMCREHLPPPGDSTYVFMCGPPPMLDRACKPNLAKLGHADGRVLCF
mmetsp:Transcript_1306/g.2999  ORF Transcript_1306/g.2999 Transcript_1306/m.2999 type:complete len:404 (-) Transcript_1306:358-1569(-)|eukprot:CAMPEP_0119353044 /NCGR_PEP_ID=MMETSP1334-20130426/2261_1 /TAXON_ID=127549 /ORGANISM="Calcidiscus leptoporus, Strain RCC1130" /LENGTH=403 /DNA_ID=CAMNT_0007366237 /DNA_START=34 /DNA_END=1245 /DNA_ORIENTATION=-